MVGISLIMSMMLLAAFAYSSNWFCLALAILWFVIAIETS